MTLTTREGLAGNYITALAFPPDGSAWIGTTHGTTHIENTRWTTLTHVHGLGDDWITALAVAPEGRVWFGTHSGGVSVFDTAARKFTTYNISNSSLPNNFVTALAVDSQNHVWIGTRDAGVARLDASSPAWTRFNLPNNAVTALALDAQGLPWVGTDGGAFHFDGAHWARAVIAGSSEIKQLAVNSDAVIVTTKDGQFRFDGKAWNNVETDESVRAAADALGVSPEAITGIAKDTHGREWVATTHGLSVLDVSGADLPKAPAPLPVVLVHGWTGPASDEIQDSEFRFLKQYAEQDGIQVFFAQGIRAENTLFENAEHLRDDIAAVKETTGADKVNLIGFSMGGLNVRAYLESSVYQNDVNRAIILGTPQAGVDVWKPILFQKMLQNPNQPSAIELTPEYSRLFNATHLPRAELPYDLLVGDTRDLAAIDFLKNLPASDGLISVASALSLNAPNVRHAVNESLHAFEPTATPFYLTSYLYPRDTYERYLRNALRDPTNSPLGSEVTSPPRTSSRESNDSIAPTLSGHELVRPTLPSASLQGSSTLLQGEGGHSRNHTPVVTQPIRAGETLTQTITLDANANARFLAYFPGGKVDFALLAPNGTRYTSGDLPLGELDGAVHLQADIASFSGYEFKKAQVGRWALILKRTDKATDPIDVTTYADLDASQLLMASAPAETVKLGQTALISAALGTRASNVKMTARIAQPAATRGGEFTLADLALYDDGAHGDGAANDGVYANTFTPTRGGYYPVFVDAIAPGFSRETELLFAVNSGGAQLDHSVGVKQTSDLSTDRATVIFTIGIQAQRAGAFAASATLHSADGKIVAHALSPVTLAVGANSADISFDRRDLTGSGAYWLDLILLDLQSAAIQIDAATNAASFQP